MGETFLLRLHEPELLLLSCLFLVIGKRLRYVQLGIYALDLGYRVANRLTVVFPPLTTLRRHTNTRLANTSCFFFPLSFVSVYLLFSPRPSLLVASSHEAVDTDPASEVSLSGSSPNQSIPFNAELSLKFEFAESFRK